MNIVYLLFSFTVGGTEKLVTDICSEMSRSGQHVHLYIVNKHYDKQMLERLPSGVTVTCRNRAVGSGSKWKEMLALFQYCKKYHIDVVHCNSLDAPELLLAAKLFVPKLKVVYTVHGMNQYATLNKLRVLYRNLFCSSIIAISNSVKDDILQQGASARKVSVVYNAIDLSKYPLQNQKKFNQDRIVIGNVARIDSAIKGQDILINAIGRLKDKHTITCYFAGAADGGHKDDLYQLKMLAQDAVHGSSSEIVFMGNVDDIPGFLSQIDLFVLPSRYEGFGISLIEAMSMGIPCISSDTNGPREIIGDHERGTLFNVNDAQDLADQLEKIITDYPRYKKQAKTAEVFVRQNYNIENMCAQLGAIYAGTGSCHL